MLFYNNLFIIGDLTNDSSQLAVRSSGQFLVVQLFTDSNIGGRGFHATFTKYYAGTSLKGFNVLEIKNYIPSFHLSMQLFIHKSSNVSISSTVLFIPPKLKMIHLSTQPCS